MSVAVVSLPGKSWRGKDAPTPRRVAAWLLAGVALWLASDAGWLHAKAWLAQQLLRDAWQDTLTTQETQHPWPWADTHPVARLTVAAHGIDQIVLAGDSGRTLAFGPGWAEASAAPGVRGNTVISGHRDTHFAFLRELSVGDEIVLESAQGLAHYRVASLRIADTRSELIALEGDDALLLVTCWPFDAVVPGGPLRYVMRAVPASPSPVGRRWREAPDEGAAKWQQSEPSQLSPYPHPNPSPERRGALDTITPS